MTGRCGSEGGYQDHVLDGSPKCAPCRRAHADKRADYRRRRYLRHAPLAVDVTGTRRRIQALAAIGYTLAEQSRLLGQEKSYAHSLTVRTWVWAATADKVRAFYDELSMTPGTSARAVNDARRRGWPVPLAWDDDTIDDPAAIPSGEDEESAPLFDDIAVQRAMRGSDVRLRPAERMDAVRRLTEMGLSTAEIAARLRLPKRSVTRHRADIRQGIEKAS